MRGPKSTELLGLNYGKVEKNFRLDMQTAAQDVTRLLHQARTSPARSARRTAMRVHLVTGLDFVTAAKGMRQGGTVDIF